MQWATWLLDLIYRLVFRKEYKVSTVGFASFLRLIVWEKRTDMCQSERATVIHRTASCLDIYRVIQEESSIFWEVILSVVVKNNSFGCVSNPEW